MAVVEKSFMLQAPPDKIWAVVSDLKSWDELTATYLWIAYKKMKFEFIEGSGAGARFQANLGRRVFMEGVMKRWEPPLFLTARAQSNIFSPARTESLLSVAITPQDSLSSKIDLRLEVNFTHPYFGIFFATFVPLRRGLESRVEQISVRLREMLESV